MRNVYRSWGKICLILPEWAAIPSRLYFRCTRVPEGGRCAVERPGRHSLAGRIGRAAKPPPQFGQTLNSTLSTQSAQKVHSKLQIRASIDDGGKSRSQHSQLGLSSSAIALFPIALRQWALQQPQILAVRAAFPPACPSRRARRGRGRAEHPRGRDSASPGMPGRAAVRPTRAGNRARCGSGRYPPHRRRVGLPGCASRQRIWPRITQNSEPPLRISSGALRHHPGGVIALALARSQLTFGLELLRDPVLQILDGIAADAKLDQVQHVFRVRLSGRSWPLFDSLLVRSGQSQATDPIPPWRGSSSRLCPFAISSAIMVGVTRGQLAQPTAIIDTSTQPQGFCFFPKIVAAPPR